MTGGGDPNFIVQIRLTGRWTSALRLASASDEARAKRTYEKLVKAGHYEAVRVLRADGQREGRTIYRLLVESGDLDVTNPVPPKLSPKPRFLIERRKKNGQWKLGKELATRDDAFALALRYHRQDPRGEVRILEQVGPDQHQVIMHRKGTLPSGARLPGRPANENRQSASQGGPFGFIMGGDGSGRRRNAFLMIACFVGLLIVTRNELDAGSGLMPKKPEPTLTGLISVEELGPEKVREACETPPELSVAFFESIRVSPADQKLLADYLEVVRTIGSAWSFRQSGESCHVTLTGGAPSAGEIVPTQIDCRIGDFFFTQFGRPSAARAAEDGCHVL
ncbi:MAG: hypothetical protein AAFW76_00230 [Pseudomonadota bacterium]